MLKIVIILAGVFAGLFVLGAVLVVTLAPEGFVTSLGRHEAGIEVRMKAAEETTLIETVSAPGEIEPLTKVEISSEVSARIERLPYREGDVVTEGDAIVYLDDLDLRASLRSAKARRDGEQFRLQSEQANLDGLVRHLSFANKTMQRQTALYESGDVSRSVLDEAAERVEDLQASVEASTHLISVIESSLAASEADIERAEDALANTVIRSPIDGILTQLNAEVGEVVLVGTMNNPGTVIMTIADLGRMIHNARIAETDVAKVDEGQTAKIHINAYPEEVFNGVVRKIALQRTVALDGTGYFETEIELELHGRRIYSGLVANVDVEIAEHEGVVVESQAVVERLVEELPSGIRGSELVDPAKKVTTVVYRVIDGKSVCTPVKPGASDLTHTLILDGIQGGEAVIVGPYKVLESIKHDEAVRDVEAEAAAAEEAGGEAGE